MKYGAGNPWPGHSKVAVNPVNIKLPSNLSFDTRGIIFEIGSEIQKNRTASVRVHILKAHEILEMKIRLIRKQFK